MIWKLVVQESLLQWSTQIPIWVFKWQCWDITDEKGDGRYLWSECALRIHVHICIQDVPRWDVRGGLIVE